MRVQSSNDTHKMVLENIGYLLKVLKKKNKDANNDEHIKAFTKLQLSNDLEDLKEEWHLAVGIRPSKATF